MICSTNDSHEGTHLVLELNALLHLARVAVDEEALAAVLQLLEHRLGDQVKHDLQRHQFALLHHRIQLTAASTAAGHFGAQQIATAQVRQAVRGDHLLALRALAAAGTACKLNVVRARRSKPIMKKMGTFASFSGFKSSFFRSIGAILFQS